MEYLYHKPCMPLKLQMFAEGQEPDKVDQEPDKGDQDGGGGAHAQLALHPSHIGQVLPQRDMQPRGLG